MKRALLACLPLTAPDSIRARLLSDHLSENFIHLIEGERAQCLRPHIAARSDTEREHRGGLIVGCLANGNDIARPERPIDFLDSRAGLCSHLLKGVSPFHGLLDVLDALIAEAGEDNESGHRNLRMLAPSRYLHPTLDCCRSISPARPVAVRVRDLLRQIATENDLHIISGKVAIWRIRT